MSVIRERALRPYIALETFQPTANPFVIGAGRIGASKLQRAGTPIVWREWTNNVLNIDASRGGKAVDIAHVNDVGTLSVTLRDLTLDMQDPEFVAGQRVRLIHINGTKRHTIFTGSIQEIELHRLRFASRRAPVSVLQFVAVDAVRSHNEITRYGALPETGTETLAARLERLSLTADAPIAQPTEPIPGLLGRTVYESSISNHLDIACNTVGAFWYVDGDGITRVRRRRISPEWAVRRRNLHWNPYNGGTVTGGLAQGSNAYSSANATGTYTTGAGWQYLQVRTLPAGSRFGIRRSHSTPIAAGTRVRFQARSVNVLPVALRGRLYVDFSRAAGGLFTVQVPWESGQILDHTVTVPADVVSMQWYIWIEPRTGAWSGTFDWGVSHFSIEDAATSDGTLVWGNTDPSGISTRTRWEGAAFSSPSLLEYTSNVATIAERREEFPGVKFPEGTLQLIRYTGARGSRVTYTGLDYDNHGAQIDPENPGTWLADDQLYHGVRLDAARRYGLRVATLPTNFPDDPGATGGHDLVTPYAGDAILVETVVWNAQEDLARVPDLDVGSYIDLPMIGDLSVGVHRSYIVGGVRHTITPTRWLIELSLIGVPRAL